MDAWRVIGAFGLAAVSGTAGWLLHGGVAPEPAAPSGAAPAAARQRAGTTVADGGSLIAVSDDGRVTLRVEQQPLEWVLEQLAQQTGRPQGLTAAVSRTASAPGAAQCAEPPAPELLTAPQTAQLIQAIRLGSEQQRLDGLMQAREAGVPLDDSTLRALFEADASEQVRLRAFETFLENRSGNTEETRRALESALYVPSAAIQSEARALLQQLQDYERADTGVSQQTEP